MTHMNTLPWLQAIICIVVLSTFSVSSSDQVSSVIRVHPSIDNVIVSWPCSVDFSSASLEFFSDSSSSLTLHSGSSSISVKQCCLGSELSCEWVVSPLLSGTTYRMELVIFRETNPDAESTNTDPPSIYLLTTHTLSPFVALQPSLSFTCDSILISWLKASPRAFSSLLQSQQLIAIRNGSGTDQDTTVLLDLPAAQNIAKLLLPLPSMLSGVSVQFVIISFFGPTRDGILTNSSSQPSEHFNFSHGRSPVSEIAATAGMEVFADSTSVTVMLKEIPAFAVVALFSSSEFPFIGCNRSRSSIKISGTGYNGCASCGFQKASRVLTFEQLPSSSEWTVALCVPIISPPSPCSGASGALSAATTIFVRTSSSLQPSVPDIIGANIMTRGVRVCWRYMFSRTSIWNVTMFFNSTSSITFIKEPADLIVESCSVSRSCSICGDFALDVDSFCSIKSNSKAVIIVTFVETLYFNSLNRSSSGYPMFSLCAPPPPKMAACLMTDITSFNEGFVNISWPLQPISVTHLLLTVYHSGDSSHTSVIHNVSVTASPRFVSLPLPLGISHCLVARSFTILNVFSQTSTPICGLQILKKTSATGVVILNRSGTSMTIHFSPPLNSSLDAFLKRRCTLRLLFGASSATYCDEHMTIPSLTAVPAYPSDLNFSRFYGASPLTESLNWTDATNLSIFSNFFVSPIHKCIVPSSFAIYVSSLPKNFGLMRCVRVSVACGAWDVSEFSYPDMDAIVSWQASAHVASINESGARILFSIRHTNDSATTFSASFPFTDIIIFSSDANYNSYKHPITHSSFRRDSFFIYISLPIAPCSNEISLGYTVHCGTGCVLSNSSFDRVKPFCPPPPLPVFTSLVAGSSSFLMQLGNSSMLSPRYFYSLTPSISRFCGSVIVNLEATNSGENSTWSSGWVPCLSSIKIPVSLSYQSFKILARTSDRFGLNLSPWTSSPTLSTSLSHFSTKCDLISNCTGMHQSPSSLSNSSIIGITSLGAHIVRIFLAARLDAILFFQLRCFCNNSVNNIKNTFLVSPGTLEFDAFVPSLCSCILLIAPAYVSKNNEVSRSCFSPPSVLPLSITGSSSCIIFERSFSPCFSFISPPYAVSALAVASSNFAHVLLTIMLQGDLTMSTAKFPQKLMHHDSRLYDSVFSAVCDSCNCDYHSVISSSFDTVFVLSNTSSFACNVHFNNSVGGANPAIICPIKAFTEHSSVTVVLSLNGNHARSPALVSSLSPSLPFFLLQPSVYSLANRKNYSVFQNFTLPSMRLEFQVYGGTLPTQCFLNVTSSSNSRIYPLKVCESTEISSSILFSPSGGSVSVLAVNSLGSIASLPIPLIVPSSCSALMHIQGCSHDSINLQFEYFAYVDSVPIKVLLSYGSCQEVILSTSGLSVFDLSSFPPGLTINSLQSSSSFCLILIVKDVVCTRLPFTTAPAPLSFLQTSIFTRPVSSSLQNDYIITVQWEYAFGAQSCSVSASVRTYCNWDSAWHDFGSSLFVPCLLQEVSISVPSYWSHANVQVRSANGKCESSFRDFNVTLNASAAVPPISSPPFIVINSSEISRPSATISWSLTKALHASVVSVQLHLIHLSCSVYFNSSCASPSSESTTIYDVSPSSTMYTVTVVPSATYAVRIVLLNSFGPSIPSSLSNIVSTLTPPPLPTVVLSNSTFLLHWPAMSFSGSVYLDIWNSSNWSPVLSNAPIHLSFVTINISLNFLYRLKVAAITEVPLESPWISLHTLVAPRTVSFDRISNNVFRVAWQTMSPISTAEIGYIARLCTRRVNVSEVFTCSRVVGSAVGCADGLSVPSPSNLLSSMSLFDPTLISFASLILCSRNSSISSPINGEMRLFADLNLEIRNTVAYVQVAKVSWFGFISAWSPPSEQISYPFPILPTASITKVQFGSSPLFGTPSIIFQLNATSVRLQLVRAVAIVSVPGDSGCPTFDPAALGDTRCSQKRSLICSEDGHNRTCENILHCNIAPFIASSCISSGAIIWYSGISYSGSSIPSAYLPLSVFPSDFTKITAFIVSINWFAVSSPSSVVSMTLPCQPPSDVSVIQSVNGFEVRFLSTPPCSHVLRLWSIGATLEVSLLQELQSPDSPVLLTLLPRGTGLAVTLSSLTDNGVESLSSPPVPFVLPPDQPTDVRLNFEPQGQLHVIWSQPVLPVSKSLPFNGYTATPLTEIAEAFAASEFGNAGTSQHVIVASLESGSVVDSVNASLSAGSVLLSPPLQSSRIIYVARRSFGVRSEWVPIIRDPVRVGTNLSSNPSNIQQAWCMLQTEESSAGVGGIYISSSSAGSVLVAATRCGVGSFANASIEVVGEGAPTETLDFGDDGLGHASAVMFVRSWPHPQIAVGRTVTVLAPNHPRASCQLSAVGVLQTSPVVFECSPCTTLALPSESLSSIGYKFGVHWTVLLALNTHLQPSDKILAKAVRFAHQFHPYSADVGYFSTRGLRLVAAASNSTCVLPASTCV